MAILVDENARLSKALDLHPNVLEYIVSLNPHDFKRLHNPLMRKLMPPRIQLKRIAAMTGTPIVDLLDGIHHAAGSGLTENDRRVLADRTAGGEFGSTDSIEEPPAWAVVEPAEIVDLLEADERLDADPIIPITQAIRRAGPGGVVVIKHKWEPQPLYDIWDKAGVDHWASQHGEGEWWVFVRKAPPPP